MIYIFRATHRSGQIETVEVPAKDYNEALNKLYFGGGFGVIDRSDLLGTRRANTACSRRGGSRRAKAQGSVAPRG